MLPQSISLAMKQVQLDTWFSFMKISLQRPKKKNCKGSDIATKF